MDAETVAADMAVMPQTDALRAALPPHLTNKHDNGTLARFLVARNGDVAKAAEMLIACDSWRKLRSLDEAAVPPHVPVSIPVRGYRCVADSNLPAENTGLLPDYCHRLNKYWAGGSYHGVDREGQPVFIERVGYHDAKGLAKNVNANEFLEWHIRNMEFFQRVLLKECEERSRKRTAAQCRGVAGGGEVGQSTTALEEGVPSIKPKMTAIFDCAGMGFHQLHIPALKFAQAVTELDQKYYPETLKMLLIVNAPRMFVSVSKVINRWLDPSVIDKIKILGGETEYKPVLTKYIPEHALPQFLGGTCTCSHMAGGCVPSEVIGNIKAARHRADFPYSVALAPRSGKFAKASDQMPSAAHTHRVVVSVSMPDEGKGAAAAIFVRFRTDVCEVDFEVRKCRTATESLDCDGDNSHGIDATHGDLSVLPQKTYAANLYPVTVHLPRVEAGEYVLSWELPPNVLVPEPCLEYAVSTEGNDNAG